MTEFHHPLIECELRCERAHKHLIELEVKIDSCCKQEKEKIICEYKIEQIESEEKT